MERPQTTLTASLLAKDFHRRIREALAPDELVLVDATNEEVNDENQCATHDHTDANVIMEDAFFSVTRRAADWRNEYDVVLWNLAWGLAVCNGFSKDWDDRPRPG